MLPPSPILATKIHVPPARRGWISRTRLAQRLESSLASPLVLVSAPPGFGKTTMVADWIAVCQAEDAARQKPLHTLLFTWLSLDEDENSPALFWRYVIAAIQTAFPNCGASAQAMLASPQPPVLEAVLTALINDLSSISNPLAVVLDDYHLITNPAVHESLLYLLDHQPESLHLILLTREDPPLALARRRARRQVLEIRGTDLRFTSEETALFLNGTMGLFLTANQVDLLEKRTEGWAAGLQLAAVSLQGCEDVDAFLRAFAGDDRYIADYLIEEVLQHQPEELQRFLLETSILEQLSGPLCVMVTGQENSQEILCKLEQDNLFIIALDNRRAWFRYHTLFASLLQRRLAQSIDSEKIAGLHRQAAAWFEQNLDPAAAVRHLLRIPDEEQACDVLERTGPIFFYRCELPVLTDLIHSLSENSRAGRPRLNMITAWAETALENRAGAYTCLAAIERHFRSSAEDVLADANASLELRTAMFETAVTRMQLDIAECHMAELRMRGDRLLSIMQSLPADAVCLFNTVASLHTVIVYDMATTEKMDGQIEPAIHWLTESIALAEKDNNDHILQLALGHLADCYQMRGELQEAEKTYLRAIAAVERSGGIPSPFAALNNAGLGLLRYERNDLEGASQCLKKAAELGRLWRNWEGLYLSYRGLIRLKCVESDWDGASRLADELDLLVNPAIPLEHEAVTWLRARVDAERGSRQQALYWSETCGLSPHSELTIMMEEALLNFSRVLFHLGKWKEAETLLDRIVAYTTEGGRCLRALEARLLHALTLNAQGDLIHAREMFVPVLEESARLGLVRMVLDGGEAARDLLLACRAQVPPSIAGYTTRLLQGFSTGVGTRQAPIATFDGLVEPLSEREKDVLRLVADGLSNQEIADRLMISITTVKTHVGNLLRKLDATSRIQAVNRALSLGLLPKK